MRKKAKGFTFIELIMIIVIVGIAVVPLIQMFTTSLKGSADTEATSIALELAQDKMEETKQLGFAATSSPSVTFASPFTAYSYQVTVSYVDQNFEASVPATNYKKVEVKVTHSSGTSTTLTTVVSNHS
ncbi:MAG: prepilin-type N-terminal cleavage/methylation domain-containing protein [Proteobacteria bacterium]|nr:prepilin-type N-terminal cleavage/methylation domain-containing protein [Pseudomonadota bacterium]